MCFGNGNPKKSDAPPTHLLPHTLSLCDVVVALFPEPGGDEVPLRALPGPVFPAAGRLRGPRPARCELDGDRAGGCASSIPFLSKMISYS